MAATMISHLPRCDIIGGGGRRSRHDLGSYSCGALARDLEWFLLGEDTPKLRLSVAPGGRAMNMAATLSLVWACAGSGGVDEGGHNDITPAQV